jgi:D-lactate dehydrogenase
MKIAFFSTHRFEREVFEKLNREHYQHQCEFFETTLSESTVALGRGFEAICAFVNDTLSAAVIEDLAKHGLRIIALRSAGFNHVDRDAAVRCGVTVVRVPAYSPHAVAEHALCLLLTINRKVHRAHQRVRELNFSLDGLVGFDIYGKTVGVIGTGKIGRVFIDAMLGLGASVLAYDPYPDPETATKSRVTYTGLNDVISQSDIISLHCPLTKESFHLIGPSQIASMKRGVYIINTSRGGLIDTQALIDGLKSGVVAGAGLDVYEEEEGIFFSDLSDTILQDDLLARLLTFPNVVVTAHQAFLTHEALDNIATTTLSSVRDFEQAKLQDEVLVR